MNELQHEGAKTSSHEHSSLVLLLRPHCVLDQVNTFLALGTRWVNPTKDPVMQNHILKEMAGQPSWRLCLETGGTMGLSWDASAGVRSTANSVIHIADSARAACKGLLKNKTISSIQAVEPAALGRQSQT